MFAWLKTYVVRRRFERFFVKPFQPEIQAKRSLKVRGVRALKQRQFLHACLGSSRDHAQTASGAGR